MSTQNSQAYQAPLFGLQTAGSTLEDSKLLRQLKMQALKVNFNNLAVKIKSN